MSKAEFVPAIGEQFNSVWNRGLNYKGFDMKFFTKDSHFEYNIGLQSCYYGMFGVGKKAKTNYRDMIRYPKDKTLIGDSVDYKETIIIKKRNEDNFLHIEIGKFVDMFLNKEKNISKSGHEFLNIENYEVLTIDDNFKICWKKINQVIRHKINKDALELETIGGKCIKITKDHSLIQLKDISKFKNIEGNKLKEKDYIISYDKLECLNEKDIKFFNFDLLYKEKPIKFRLYITDLELKIMGYLIGDGYINKKHNVLGLSGIQEIGAKNIWKEFAKKYNCNIGYSSNNYDSTIASKKLVTSFLKLGLGGYSYNKEIPNWILNLPKNKLGNFLNGYFSADGTIKINDKKEITVIGVGSISYKLINDVKIALDKLGIRYNNGYNKEKIVKINKKEYLSKQSWYISIYDKNSIMLFKKYIGFTNVIKQNRLVNDNFLRQEKLQHGNLPCDIVKDFCKFGNQIFIDKRRVNHIISKSDIGCYRIKNIRNTKFNTEYVYDISVNKVERFLCSGILVHNSGGFQIASFAKKGEVCNLKPIDSLRWQEANCDVMMNLDVPPTLDKVPTYEDFMKALNTSVENFKLFETERKRHDNILLNVLHGENIKLMDIWYDKVKDFKFDGYAVGMKPPYSPMIQAMGFMYLWEKGEYDKESFKWLHFFGTSGKHVVPTIVYAASKLKGKRVTYDSSSYNIGSIFRTYYMPFDIGPHLSFGDKFQRVNPHLKELPCNCPVCKTVDNVDILNGKDIYAGTLISLHNMYQYIYYNDVLNSLVNDKDKFLEYVKKICGDGKALKSIEFIDFAIERGLSNAIIKFKNDLIPQDLKKTKQVDIFNF